MALQAYVYGEKRALPDGFAAFVDPSHTAIVSIDMHEGHLADTPDCPCPAPRAREIVAPIDRFHDQARALGVPIIHVRAVLRKGGVDDVNGLPAAFARPFSRRICVACSKSPSASVSAFLASIIPAPVALRSS
jgi:nicotinamidase-related amidase